MLRDAIRAGGTTLRDYINPEGMPGYFRQKLYVYERTANPAVCAARRSGSSCRGSARRTSVRSARSERGRSVDDAYSDAARIGHSLDFARLVVPRHDLHVAGLSRLAQLVAVLLQRRLFLRREAPGSNDNVSGMY